MRKPQAGFTIIELLIVLAIAGMIILIVFLAVPAMQRNSRNHQRRQDASRVIAYINEQRSLTNTLPNSCNNTNTSCFLRDVPMTMYDNQSTSSNNVSFHRRPTPFNDGSDAQLDPSASNALTRISIRSFSKCNDKQLTGVGAGRYDVAAQFAVEASPGNNILYCLEF